MPTAPPRACRNASSGCPRTTTSKDGWCDGCRSGERKRQDRRRGSAAERGYAARWRAARLAFLRARPLCECEDCTRDGLTTAAEVVDHVIPHRGDQRLFWDRSNWRPMSKRCHDRKTAREDNPWGRRG